VILLMLYFAHSVRNWSMGLPSGEPLFLFAQIPAP